MKEDFLHYLWCFQKLGTPPLTTFEVDSIEVIHPGTPNGGGGPDFLNAKIWIGDTLWVGDVELYLKASSWYHHQHHLDKQYDSVVLHVFGRTITKFAPPGSFAPMSGAVS